MRHAAAWRLSRPSAKFVTDLADGAWDLRVGTNGGPVIEFEDHLVMFEAGGSPADTMARIDAANELVSGTSGDRRAISGYEPPGRGPSGQMAHQPELYLANPCNLWASERLEHKKAVLKLAFADRLTYVRNKGSRTPLQGVSGSQKLQKQIGAPMGCIPAPGEHFVRGRARPTSIRRRCDPINPANRNRRQVYIWNPGRPRDR
jgi:hypothetical protein